jgi:hypothetical protein
MYVATQRVTVLQVVPPKTWRCILKLCREVVVFRPLGNGKIEVVARVAPRATWSEWAE